MFTLTITLDEAGNAVHVHGTGNKATEGEQSVASSISRDIERHVKQTKTEFDSDVKVESPEQLDIEELMAELMAGEPTEG